MLIAAAAFVGMALFVHPSAPTASATSVAAPASTLAPAPVAVFLGDSFTAGVGSTGGSGFTARVSDALGWRSVVLGDGGTGFTSPRDPFSDRLPQVVKADPAFVIVQGGTNDGGTDTGTRAAQLFAELHKQLPHAVIVAVGPTQPTNPLYSQDRMNAARQQISAAAKAAGVPFIDPIAEGWLTSPDQLADRVHPTDAGYRVYADRLVADLRKLLPAR
jgi:lysophospholipase L1-like esterase